MEVNKNINRSPSAVFKEKVAMKYQLLNDLFLTLPFEDLDKVGAELPSFSKYVRAKIEKAYHPKMAVEQYFRKQGHRGDFKKMAERLFKFLQFVERQVVLFDALEDAAFDEVQDLNGEGTLKHLFHQVKSHGNQQSLLGLLKEYGIRIVLTAHPTQFYPGSVLGIITDLTKSIKENNLTEINDLLLQMGKTSFRNKTKPTPEEEARSLIWYLANIFYEVIPSIVSSLSLELGKDAEAIQNRALIELGFWPGGDRDGNPLGDARDHALGRPKFKNHPAFSVSKRFIASQKKTDF